MAGEDWKGNTLDEEDASNWPNGSSAASERRMSEDSLENDGVV